MLNWIAITNPESFSAYISGVAEELSHSAEGGLTAEVSELAGFAYSML